MTHGNKSHRKRIANWPMSIYRHTLYICVLIPWWHQWSMTRTEGGKINLDVQMLPSALKKLINCYFQFWSAFSNFTFIFSQEHNVINWAWVRIWGKSIHAIDSVMLSFFKSIHTIHLHPIIMQIHTCNPIQIEAYYLVCEILTVNYKFEHMICVSV